MKIKKNRVVRVGGGVRVDANEELKCVFFENSKENRAGGWGCQGGCEQRNEVFVKNQKNRRGGGGG